MALYFVKIYRAITKGSVGIPLGKVIAIINDQPAVGKTTTAVQLSMALTKLGKAVLVIDSDPKGEASVALGVQQATLLQCLYDVLVVQKDVAMVVQHTASEVTLLPAREKLQQAVTELATVNARELQLKNALIAVQAQYDYIIIDCPSQRNLLMINALVAANSVLIPIKCTKQALINMPILIQFINFTKKHFNASLKIEGVLMTMLDIYSNKDLAIIDEVKSVFGNKVYRVVIPLMAETTLRDAHRDTLSTSYAQLAQEVIANDKIF